MRAVPTANYFNQELYGGPTTLPWALRIDSVHRPVDTPTIDLYHPTFLYVRPAAHRLRDPADAGEREKLAEFLGVDEESLDAKMSVTPKGGGGRRRRIAGRPESARWPCDTQWSSS